MLRNSIRELWSNFRNVRTYATASATASAVSKEVVKPHFSAIVLYVPSGICAYLAYWQYQRSAWKDNLISLRMSELAKDDAADVFSLGKEITPYQKVVAKGIYRNEDSVYMGPRPRNIAGHGMQSGYMVFTPMYKTDNWLNLPAALPDGPYLAEPEPTKPAKSSWFGGKAAKPSQSAADEDAAPPKLDYPVVEQVCLVMQSETPNLAVLANKPDVSEFHWLESEVLAEACGLPRDTPILQAISEDPSTIMMMKAKSPLDAQRADVAGRESGPPTFPVPKHATDMLKFGTMPTDHLVYMATWVSLFVVLGIMATKATFQPSKGFKMVNVDNQKLWKAPSDDNGNREERSK
eukprot:gene26109-11824_t